jgi:hypothetical protein
VHLKFIDLGRSEDKARKSLCKAKKADLDVGNGTLKASKSDECDDSNEDYEAKVGGSLLFIGQFVSGIGLCLFYPLGWSFYDDNVDPKHAPFFHGITNGVIDKSHVIYTRVNLSYLSVI